MHATTVAFVVLAASVAATPVHSPTAPTAQASPAATPEAPLEPSRQEVLQLLFRHADMRLTEGRYCGYSLPGTPAPTLGDWLGKLFSDMESGDNTVEVACDPLAPAAASADATFTCHVDVVHVDGDDHWKWGVSLGVRALDRTLAKDSFECSRE